MRWSFSSRSRCSFSLDKAIEKLMSWVKSFSTEVSWSGGYEQRSSEGHVYIEAFLSIDIEEKSIVVYQKPEFFNTLLTTVFVSSQPELRPRLWRLWEQPLEYKWLSPHQRHHPRHWLLKKDGIGNWKKDIYRAEMISKIEQKMMNIASAALRHVKAFLISESSGKGNMVIK